MGSADHATENHHDGRADHGEADHLESLADGPGVGDGGPIGGIVFRACATAEHAGGERGQCQSTEPGTRRASPGGWDGGGVGNGFHHGMRVGSSGWK